MIDSGVAEMVALIENLTSVGLILLFVILLIRKTIMLRGHHEEVIEQKDLRHADVRDQLQARLQEIEADRDWWKEASVTSLRIGEQLIDSERGR